MTRCAQRTARGKLISRAWMPRQKRQLPSELHQQRASTFLTQFGPEANSPSSTTRHLSCAIVLTIHPRAAILATIRHTPDGDSYATSD